MLLRQEIQKFFVAGILGRTFSGSINDTNDNPFLRESKFMG
jgi:hypothetical protein